MARTMSTEEAAELRNRRKEHPEQTVVRLTTEVESYKSTNIGLQQEWEIKDEMLRQAIAEVERLTAGNAELLDWVKELDGLRPCTDYRCNSKYGDGGPCSACLQLKDEVYDSTHPGQVLLDRLAKLEATLTKIRRIMKTDWSRIHKAISVGEAIAALKESPR